MEEGIVSWKSSSEGEKELLTGELRDQAGSAGSDWFAFDVARMGSATEEQRAAYLPDCRMQWRRCMQTKKTV
mgnify:FL=1